MVTKSGVNVTRISHTCTFPDLTFVVNLCIPGTYHSACHSDLHPLSPSEQDLEGKTPPLALLASPSEKAYATINDSPEAITFSWELTSTPVAVTGFKPTSIITIDSTKVDAAKLAALEEVLYGGAGEEEAHLPLPDEVKTLMSTGA